MVGAADAAVVWVGSCLKANAIAERRVEMRDRGTILKVSRGEPMWVYQRVVGDNGVARYFPRLTDIRFDSVDPKWDIHDVQRWGDKVYYDFWKR